MSLILHLKKDICLHKLACILPASLSNKGYISETTIIINIIKNLCLSSHLGFIVHRYGG